MITNRLEGDCGFFYAVLQEDETISRGVTISFDSVVDQAVRDFSADTAIFWATKSVERRSDLNELEEDSHSSIIEDDDIGDEDVLLELQIRSALRDSSVKAEGCFKKKVSFCAEAIEISQLGKRTEVPISDEKKRVHSLPFLSKYEDIVFAFIQRVEELAGARLGEVGMQPSSEALLVMKQMTDDLQVLSQSYTSDYDFKETGKEAVRSLLSATVRAFSIQELELDRELLHLFASNPGTARNLWHRSDFQRAVRKEKSMSILEREGLDCNNYTNTLSSIKIKDVRLTDWEVDFLLEAIDRACDEFFLVY